MKTMKKTLSMFVVFMLVLTAVPMVFAQNTTSTEQTSQEYPTMTRVMDRIKLAFTFQTERKLELMNRIQEKRQAHYQFLLGKGKTDQAEKFRQGTTGLETKFGQWKANKQEIIAKMEQNRVQQQIANQGAGYQIREQERLRDTTLHETTPAEVETQKQVGGIKQ